MSSLCILSFNAFIYAFNSLVCLYCVLWTFKWLIHHDATFFPSMLYGGCVYLCRNSEWGLRDTDDLKAMAGENSIHLQKMVSLLFWPQPFPPLPLDISLCPLLLRTNLSWGSLCRASKANASVYKGNLSSEMEVSLSLNAGHPWRLFPFWLLGIISERVTDWDWL